jgi:hypothetical protein
MDLLSFATQQAQKFGVDPGLVQRILQAESGGNPTALSPAGAYGPMQLMPETAKELGVNIADPLDNIRGGVQYLSQLSQKFGGDPRLMAAAYNAGPGAVQRSLAKTGDIPNYPETQAYVQKVAGGDMGSKINPDWLEPADGAAAAAGAAQGAQAPAGPQPVKINPDWLESAEPSKTRASAAPVAAPESQGVLSRMLSNAMGVRLDPQQKQSVLGLQMPKVSLSPGTGGFLRGLVSPIDLADKYIAAPLTRMIPESLGGNPNEQPIGLGNMIAAHTASPENAIDSAAAQVGTFTGGALSMGKVLEGAGGLAKIPGISRIPGVSRVGGFLSNAGQITPGTLPGAVAGGFAAEGADKLVGQHLGSPLARTAFDMAAGALGGAPFASLGNRIGNGITNADNAAAVSAAKSANVPIQMSDLRSTWQNLKTAVADKVPFGNIGGTKVPERQLQGVRRALGSAAEKYRPAGLDDTAGASGTDRFIANDLRGQYGAAKQATNAAYNEVQKVLAKNPNLPPIDLAGTKAQVQTLLEQFPDTFRDLTLSSQAKKVLGVLGRATTPQENPVNLGGSQLDLSTNPALRAALEKAGVSTQSTPTVSFQEARDLSSELWDLANRAQRGAYASAGSQKQAGALKSLASAVGDDLDSYMATAPAPVRAAYAAADQTFKSRVLPFRQDPKLYKLVSSRTPQTDFDTAAQGIYSNLFNTAQGERSAMALSLMSPQGKQAAAYQALKDAGEKGLSTASPNGLKAAAANRALDIEGNPALANIAKAYPALASEADRIASLLQIGRSAANENARKGAATGIQAVKGVTALGQLGMAQKLAEHYGTGIGIGAGVVLPIGAANLFNLLNRYGPRMGMLANPGTVGQRVAPGAVQGLLAPERDQRR